MKKISKNTALTSTLIAPALALVPTVVSCNENSRQALNNIILNEGKLLNSLALSEEGKKLTASQFIEKVRKGENSLATYTNSSSIVRDLKNVYEGINISFETADENGMTIDENTYNGVNLNLTIYYKGAIQVIPQYLSGFRTNYDYFIEVCGEFEKEAKTFKANESAIREKVKTAEDIYSEWKSDTTLSKSLNVLKYISGITTEQLKEGTYKGINFKIADNPSLDTSSNHSSKEGIAWNSTQTNNAIKGTELTVYFELSTYIKNKNDKNVLPFSKCVEIKIPGFNSYEKKFNYIKESYTTSLSKNIAIRDTLKTKNDICRLSVRVLMNKFYLAKDANERQILLNDVFKGFESKNSIVSIAEKSAFTFSDIDYSTNTQANPNANQTLVTFNYNITWNGLSGKISFTSGLFMTDENYFKNLTEEIKNYSFEPKLIPDPSQPGKYKLITAEVVTKNCATDKNKVKDYVKIFESYNDDSTSLVEIKSIDWNKTDQANLQGNTLFLGIDIKYVKYEKNTNGNPTINPKETLTSSQENIKIPFTAQYTIYQNQFEELVQKIKVSTTAEAKNWVAHWDLINTSNYYRFISITQNDKPLENINNITLDFYGGSKGNLKIEYKYNWTATNTEGLEAAKNYKFERTLSNTISGFQTYSERSNFNWLNLFNTSNTKNNPSDKTKDSSGTSNYLNRIAYPKTEKKESTATRVAGTLSSFLGLDVTDPKKYLNLNNIINIPDYIKSQFMEFWKFPGGNKSDPDDYINYFGFEFNISNVRYDETSLTFDVNFKDSYNSKNTYKGTYTQTGFFHPYGGSSSYAVQKSSINVSDYKWKFINDIDKKWYDNKYYPTYTRPDDVPSKYLHGGATWQVTWTSSGWYSVAWLFNNGLVNGDKNDQNKWVQYIQGVISKDRLFWSTNDYKLTSMDVWWCGDYKMTETQASIIGEGAVPGIFRFPTWVQIAWDTVAIDKYGNSAAGKYAQRKTSPLIYWAFFKNNFWRWF